MKKLNLTFYATIFIIFSLITPLQAEGKIVPPDSIPLTPEQAADKIVYHTVILVDAYIKELPSFTCTFPDGGFNFTLDNDFVVEVHPACIGGYIYRTIGFIFGENCETIDSEIICPVAVTVLDGPVGEPPGEIDPGLMTNVKKILADQLLESKMIVKKVFKEERRFDLSLQDDMQKFYELIYESIKISTPLFEIKPTMAVLPKGIAAKIEVTPEKKVAISGDFAAFKEIRTKLKFGEKEKRIKIEADEIKKESKIEIENKVTVTKEKIKIKESKLYLAEKEIKITPAEAISKVELASVDKNELKISKEKKPIYEIKGKKEAKLLWFIPIKLPLKVEINAESGLIEKIIKPWWSFLAW